MKMFAWSAPMFFATIALAQTATDPVWRENRTFGDLSTTATSITGPISIAGSSLTFDDQTSVSIDSVGMASASWDFDADPQTGEVFRLASDPGKLRNGNTLCVGPATYVVFYEDDSFARTLSMVVFGSAQPPQNIQSGGFCGTYNYVID